MLNKNSLFFLDKKVNDTISTEFTPFINRTRVHSTILNLKIKLFVLKTPLNSRKNIMLTRPKFHADFCFESSILEKKLLVTSRKKLEKRAHII